MATILVIEDDVALLAVVEKVLVAEGHQAVTAATVFDAETVLYSDREIDVVLTDIGLGDEHDGGLRIGQIIQRARPKTPIIYTTGQSLTRRMKSQFIPGSAFIPKPYKDADILDLVAGLMREGNTEA